MCECLQETRLHEFFFIILIAPTVTFVPWINIFAEKRIRKLGDFSWVFLHQQKYILYPAPLGKPSCV